MPLTKKTLRSLVDKGLSMPWSAGLILLASVGSIVVALVLQEVFSILPCDLCLWQRCPYSLAAAFSLMALVARKKVPQSAVVFLALSALAYSASTGLGIFHSGVEWHWWEDLSSCVADKPLTGTSIDDLRRALLETENPPCDEVSFTILGLSLANINVLASLGLAIFAGIAAHKSRKRV